MYAICSFVRLRNVVSQAVTDITPVDLQGDLVQVRSLEAPDASQGYVYFRVAFEVILIPLLVPMPLHGCTAHQRVP